MTRLGSRLGTGLAVVVGVVFTARFCEGAAAAGDQPIRRGERLVYPEGAVIPRSLTPTERGYLREHPLAPPSRTDGPPTGPIHCVAEYEPMEGLLIAWESFTSILREIALNVTTIGDGDMYVVVDSGSEQSSAYSSLSSYGVNMDRVHFVVRQTDTVWIRDYGPRYIYEGQCRAIIDHTYNRPRPNDDAFNDYFSVYKNHAEYDLPLVHGGGNYHLNALDEGNATRLVCNENPGLTDQEIIDLWMAYQNVLTTLWTPFPSNIDSTQHIDMWMQIVADDVIIISDWPYNSGSSQDQVCDGAAADFASWGWNVYRVPARYVSYTHYTYTNMVVCNDLILLPYYTNGSVAPHNAEALAAVQAACPDKTVVQVNCESIIGSAGAVHCIVMHVPEPWGGENPTTYLKNCRGGEVFDPGEVVEVNWISDDNIGVTDVDILLSTDGGASFDIVVVEGTADDGSYGWTVPDVFTTQGRLRIVVHDADGNSGSDESDSDFTINGSGIPGDIDGDGDVDTSDLLALLADWGCSGEDCVGDVDGDGDTDTSDLLMLLANWG